MFHKKEIIENKDSNAFAKHLQVFHPDRIGDPTVFKLKVESTFSKPLERQVTEGIAITNSTADRILNSKSEYLQPAVPRVTNTREVRDHGSWLYRTEFYVNFAAQNSEYDTKPKHNQNVTIIFIHLLFHHNVMSLFSFASVLARQGSLQVSEKLCSIIFLFIQ